jgi:Arc/MetJ-type ribon-helix-helix transcriptional regulator
MTSSDNIYIFLNFPITMANKLISIRLAKTLEQDLNFVVESLGYTNVQEVIRLALIDKITELKRDIAIRELSKLQGSQKGKVASKSELQKLGKELLK